MSILLCNWSTKIEGLFLFSQIVSCHHQFIGELPVYSLPHTLPNLPYIILEALSRLNQQNAIFYPPFLSSRGTFTENIKSTKYFSCNLWPFQKGVTQAFINLWFYFPYSGSTINVSSFNSI